MIETSYSEFKRICLEKGLSPQSIIVGSNVHAVAFDGPFSIASVFSAESQDAEDFSQTFSGRINAKLDVPRDFTGRPIQRQAVTSEGWSYNAFCFEYTTKTGVLFCRDAYWTDRSSFFSVVRLDSSNAPTQEESNVVSDIVTFSPPFDYEIISGEIFSAEKPDSDLRVWVVGGCTSIGQQGTKEFVTGLNLRFETHVKTDGRASKFMKRSIQGIPYPCNEIQFRFMNHGGVEHKVQIVLEIFRS